MPATIALFIYGTLKQPYIQRALLAHTLQGKRDRLPGYRKTTVTLDDAAYPDIEPAEGEFVEGQIVHLSEEELTHIDSYEGREYARQQVTLESGETAWVYSTRFDHDSK